MNESQSKPIIWFSSEMNEEKRQRLQAAGWSIGNASDFLGLTSEEADFIELKLALARRLKQLRLSHQLSQTALAKRMNSSQSRVAKMEAGDPSVSVDLLICGLLAIGATRREVGEVIIGSRSEPENKSFELTPDFYIES